MQMDDPMVEEFIRRNGITRCPPADAISSTVLAQPDPPPAKPRSPDTDRPLTSADFKRIRDLYASGKSVHDVARELDLGPKLVSKVLKNGGVQLRGNNPGPRSKTMDELQARHAQQLEQLRRQQDQELERFLRARATQLLDETRRRVRAGDMNPSQLEALIGVLAAK